MQATETMLAAVRQEIAGMGWAVVIADVPRAPMYCITSKTSCIISR